MEGKEKDFMVISAPLAGTYNICRLREAEASFFFRNDRESRHRLRRSFSNPFPMPARKKHRRGGIWKKLSFLFFAIFHIHRSLFLAGEEKKLSPAGQKWSEDGVRQRDMNISSYFCFRCCSHCCSVELKNKRAFVLQWQSEAVRGFECVGEPRTFHISCFRPKTKFSRSAHKSESRGYSFAASKLFSVMKFFIDLRSSCDADGKKSCCCDKIPGKNSFIENCSLPSAFQLDSLGCLIKSFVVLDR